MLAGNRDLTVHTRVSQRCHCALFSVRLEPTRVRWYSDACKGRLCHKEDVQFGWICQQQSRHHQNRNSKFGKDYRIYQERASEKLSDDKDAEIRVQANTSREQEPTPMDVKKRPGLKRTPRQGRLGRCNVAGDGHTIAGRRAT